MYDNAVKKQEMLKEVLQYRQTDIPEIFSQGMLATLTSIFSLWFEVKLIFFSISM